MACVGTLLAISILSSSAVSSSGTGTAPLPFLAYSRAAGYVREDGEEEQEETVLKADSPLFYAMMREMFREEPAAQTVSFGVMDWDFQDASAFTGLAKLDLGTGLSRVRGLKELKGIISMTG